MRTAAALGAVALVASLGVYAADTGMPVHVSGESDDIVGQRLVYAVKEAIRKSGGMQLVASRGDAFLVAAIVTIDPDNDNNRTAYSLSILSKDVNAPHFDYETSSVGVCGSNRVASCAESVAAQIDELSERYKEAIADTLRDQPAKKKVVD